jgi:hypothetical protein
MLAPLEPPLSSFEFESVERFDDSPHPTATQSSRTTTTDSTPLRTYAE